MPITIPNILTLLRLALIPVFVVAYFIPYEHINVVVTVIYFIAGITDWFDGFLARKLNQQSAFGAFMDPVADKLMVVVALVLLISKHPNLWMVVPAVVIIGREIAISALREWMANGGEGAKVKVSMVGKFKTAAQMLAIGCMLYEVPLGWFPSMQAGYLLLYIAAGLTLWSMYNYLVAAWPSLVNEK